MFDAYQAFSIQFQESGSVCIFQSLRSNHSQYLETKAYTIYLLYDQNL